MRRGCIRGRRPRDSAAGGTAVAVAAAAVMAAAALMTAAAVFGGGHALEGLRDLLKHFQSVLAALQFCVSAAVIDAHGHIHIAGAGADGLDLRGALAAAGTAGAAVVCFAVVSHSLTIPF